MIVFGSQSYGRTHRVPRAFHVSTRFLHVMFFPLVPRSSWVVLEKERRLSPEEDVAYALPRIEWRSVMLAWIRAALVLIALVAAVVLCTQILLDREPTVVARTAAVLAIVGAAFWCSYRLDRPSPASLAPLLREAGVPPELVVLATSRTSET